MSLQGMLVMMQSTPVVMSTRRSIPTNRPQVPVFADSCTQWKASPAIGSLSKSESPRAFHLRAPIQSASLERASARSMNGPNRGPGDIHCPGSWQPRLDQGRDRNSLGYFVPSATPRPMKRVRAAYRLKACKARSSRRPSLPEFQIPHGRWWRPRCSSYVVFSERKTRSTLLPLIGCPRRVCSEGLLA